MTKIRIGSTIIELTERDVNRFWSKIDRVSPDGCWEWTGKSTHKFGYGIIGIGGRPPKGRTARAHRVAYAIANGGLTSHLMVCHRCDNPRCCNPSHLFLGTAKDNHRDMCAKKRNVNPPRLIGEHNLGGGKLNSHDVVEIRALRSSGEKVVVIASRFNIDPSLVSAITKRKVWRHVG